MLKKHKAINLKIILALSAALLLPLPALAITSGGVGGYPANPDPAIPYSDSWFIYNLDLGESREDAIIVTNSSAESQTVKLYAVDSVASNQGNFALESEADPRDGIGSWIELLTNLITLDPGESKQVPFIITIPENADVGEHSGGIIIQKAQAGQVSGTGASIVTRVGVRVYETVPGEIVRQIELEDFQVKRQTPTDKLAYYEVTLSVLNQSNVSLRPKVELQIGGWGKEDYLKYSRFRDGVVIDFRDLTEFFSPQTLTRDWQLLRDQKVTTRWEWPQPRFGRFTFQAALTYEDEGVRKTLLTPEIVIWVIPWIELAVTGAVLVGLIGIYILRKRALSGKGWKTYEVRPGDTLPELAQVAGISWRRLARANRLKKPYAIKAGQKILVPPPGLSRNPKLAKTKKSKL